MLYKIIKANEVEEYILDREEKGLFSGVFSIPFSNGAIGRVKSFLESRDYNVKIIEDKGNCEIHYVKTKTIEVLLGDIDASM